MREIKSIRRHRTLSYIFIYPVTGCSLKFSVVSGYFKTLRSAVKGHDIYNYNE